MIVQPDGEAAEIVRSAGAGEWVAPENPQMLAETVLVWYSDNKKLIEYAGNSSDAAQHHSRDRLAAEMLSVISDIIDAE